MLWLLFVVCSRASKAARQAWTTHRHKPWKTMGLTELICCQFAWRTLAWLCPFAEASELKCNACHRFVVHSLFVCLWRFAPTVLLKSLHVWALFACWGKAVHFFKASTFQCLRASWWPWLALQGLENPNFWKCWWAMRLLQAVRCLGLNHFLIWFVSILPAYIQCLYAAHLIWLFCWCYSFWKGESGSRMSLASPPFLSLRSGNPTAADTNCHSRLGSHIGAANGSYLIWFCPLIAIVQRGTDQL